MIPNSHQLCLLDELRRDEPALTEEDAVVRACERLLQEAEAEPPIPLERVASLRGIVDVRHAQQEWAGMLAPVASRGLVVTVRASDPFERQRFTVGHEIGHTFFPGFHQERQYRCNGAKTRLEALCDLAATELLLPRAFFRSDLGSSFDLRAVEDLADNYLASIEATALRTVDLCAGRAMLLVLTQRHKPAEAGREHLAEAKVRLDYAHASGDWPYALRHKSVSPASPLAAAFEGERVDAPAADVSELFVTDPGPVELHAKRYGRDGRVFALIRPRGRGNA